MSEEFELFLERHAEWRDGEGRQAVVRNGYLPRREVLSGIGSVPVKMPRARDRSGEGLRFRSSLVPPYVRRSKSVDAVLPWLYLKGVSTADMSEALAALVGKDAAGLSAAVVSRLKARWTQEYDAWKRSALGKGSLGVSVGRRVSTRGCGPKTGSFACSEADAGPGRP